jgi:hypothetical protein
MTRLHAVRSVSSSERGAALVMALLVLVVLTAFGLTLVGLGMTEVAISSNWRDYTKDFYAAEAGLESGIVGLRNLLSGIADPSTVTAGQLNGITAPTLNTAGTAFNVYSITLPAPMYTSTFANGPYSGLFGQVYAYSIRAQVNGQAGTRSDLTQVYNYTQVPLFQFGVFYGRGVDLEMAPGPTMTFNGRIHSNSNIYIGTQSTLNVQSYMTTAGGIYRRIKRDTDLPWYNNPQIMDAGGTYRTLNFDSTYQAGFSSTWANSAAWAAQATSTFGGKVQDQAMGVGQIIPPVPGLFYNPSNPDVVAHELIEMPSGGDSAALAAAKMYSQATVRIVDGVATGLTCGTIPSGAITTKSFYDAREGKTVSATQLDIAILRTNSCLPSGAVVYAASTAAVTGTTLPAIRLVNGSQLPSGGMTVVSQNAVYVQGDYNTVSKQAAAVMADAITVLSNNWSPNNSDTKGSQVKGNRTATNTTVNAAFMTGPSAESVANQGNGQLENSIRFLEDWTGRTMTYAGSIVALWHSLQATGSWNGNYYTPPSRAWSYDTLFNTTQPPGTPKGVVQTKGRWFQS